MSKNMFSFSQKNVRRHKFVILSTNCIAGQQACLLYLPFLYNQSIMSNPQYGTNAFGIRMPSGV